MLFLNDETMNMQFSLKEKMITHESWLLVSKAEQELLAKGFLGRQYNGLSCENLAFVAYSNSVEKPIGFIAFENIKWNDSIEINLAYVEPDFRGKGVHTKMFECLVNYARKENKTQIGSSAFIDNIKAIKAFERQGRKAISIRYVYPLKEWLSR